VRVYLDTSVFHRPFDDQSQAKIFLETQATILIFQVIESRQIELVVSEVLEYEISRNPKQEQTLFVLTYFRFATHNQTLTPAIKDRAKKLQESGIKLLDALHVACAEAANCNYMLTCDRRLINRCTSLTISVLNPVDFILELGNEG
jgi:predicted nucleic acid-binding protein